jgi:hypothetical protein
MQNKKDSRISLPAIPLAGVVAPLAFGDILRAAPAIPPAER